MIIIENTLDFKINEKTAVAMGKFDGVHLGHRRLLDEVMKKKKIGLKTCIFTFEPSPSKFFSVGDGKELSTKYEKRNIFENIGID